MTDEIRKKAEDKAKELCDSVELINFDVEVANTLEPLYRRISELEQKVEDLEGRILEMGERDE